jgi:protein TonB
VTLSSQIALSQAQDPPCFVQSSALNPILETHTIPPYPVEAVHLNEQGTVLMRADIGANGAPIDVSVLASSGFSQLDEAARNYVKTHWRWNPPHRKACQSSIRVFR